MIVVAPAAPGDLHAAAAVLAEAFVEDPVTAPVLGGAGDRADRLERAHHLFVGLLGPVIGDGTVDVARRPGEDDVLGVAIWEAPDATGSVLRLVRHLPSFLRACGVRRLGFALRTKLVVDRHRPRRPHWYLQEIGVRADVRGQGVGGALLDARLTVVDEQDAGAYLESSTERNRRLYHRNGFVDVAPVHGVPGEPMSMWRAPVSVRVVRPSSRPSTVPA